MANPAFLIPLPVGASDFVRFAILQSWLEQACINAGISLVSSNPQLVLDQVRAGDTDLQKWQKITSWANQLGANITPSTGGGQLTVVNSTSSGTLGANTYTTVTSSSATSQALPASPAANTVCVVKSKGSGVVTVTSVGSIIFASGLVSSYAVGNNGQSATFTWDGTNWNVT